MSLISEAKMKGVSTINFVASNPSVSRRNVLGLCVFHLGHNPAAPIGPVEIEAAAVRQEFPLCHISLPRRGVFETGYERHVGRNAGWEEPAHDRRVERIPLPQ
jgi:hypothetical protein